MEILAMLSQYVDGYAVIIAYAGVQLIKSLLPSPPGGGTMDVTPFYYRMMPLAPLVLGILVVVIKDGLISPTMKIDDAVVKGIVSGIGASYLYRTAKVVIFGKPEEKTKKEKIKEKEKEGQESLMHKTLDLLK